MKKLALTSLLLLTANKIVSACSYSNYSNDPNYIDPITVNNFYSKLYFFPLVFLILANFVLFFLRKQKDYLMLGIIFFASFMTIPVTFFGSFLSGCGDGLPVVLKWEFIFFLTFFVFHIGLWVNKVGLHWRVGKLTLIKLK